MKPDYDVVIVGAGPAGLAAAFEFSSISDLSILLIDKGKSIEERDCSSLERLCADHSVCNITHGSGGAGLYSYGKLCLDPTVGGDISKFYNTDETAEFMQRVVEMLSMDDQQITTESRKSTDILECRELFNRYGLDFKFYDVVRVGLKDRISKVKNLEKRLRERGIQFRFGTEVSSISANGQLSITAGKEKFSSRYLIAAPGKIGANWFYSQCENLGIRSINNPLYLGVRLEFPREITAELAKLTDNPKISMVFDNGDYVKTHCFSDKRRVVIADYNGLKLVEGSYLETAESDNAAFNIVTKINLPQWTVPFQHSRRFVEQVNSFGKGRPVVQTVKDLFEFKETDQKALKNLAIAPTLNDCRCADLGHLYSVRFADRLSRFIKQVDKVLPGFGLGENLIYAPFVEWWMKKVDVIRTFETSKPNLYAIGDGAGMSQGIIAAGMRGVACARAIYFKELTGR
ncbi:MAG TPA: hypothetical protein ENN46_01860 [Candidatus Woesearchaeota archaeon]|nr:hypothetical protein [Candidatus Woesearchaeota archaeon]